MTVQGEIRKHLGVCYKWGEDEQGKYVMTSMNQFALSIIKDYETFIQNKVKLSEVPASPGKYLLKNKGQIYQLEEYRSLIGKILYYTNKISPECANAVRELSKHMSTPSLDHWLALEKLIGYMKQKPYHQLIYREIDDFRSISYVDSKYATNTDHRRSVTGMVNTIGGMITNWMSKTQQSVTLSSTEAEYVALTTCDQETVFQNGLLSELNLCVKTGVIFEYNTGAIYWVKNKQVNSKTKHIIIRQHKIRELQEDGEIDVRFIRGEDNLIDIMTKNIPVKMFKNLCGYLHE